MTMSLIKMGCQAAGASRGINLKVSYVAALNVATSASLCNFASTGATNVLTYEGLPAAGTGSLAIGSMTWTNFLGNPSFVMEWFGVNQPTPRSGILKIPQWGMELDLALFQYLGNANSAGKTQMNLFNHPSIPTSVPWNVDQVVDIIWPEETCTVPLAYNDVWSPAAYQGTQFGANQIYGYANGTGFYIIPFGSLNPQAHHGQTINWLGGGTALGGSNPSNRIRLSVNNKTIPANFWAGIKLAGATPVRYYPFPNLMSVPPATDTVVESSNSSGQWFIDNIAVARQISFAKGLGNVA